MYIKKKRNKASLLQILKEWLFSKCLLYLKILTTNQILVLRIILLIIMKIVAMKKHTNSLIKKSKLGALIVILRINNNRKITIK